MDEMKIVSTFATGLISKLVRKQLLKQGYDIDLQLRGITASITDQDINIHLDVGAKLSKDELVRILNTVA